MVGWGDGVVELLGVNNTVIISIKSPNDWYNSFLLHMYTTTPEESHQIVIVHFSDVLLIDLLKHANRIKVVALCQKHSIFSEFCCKVYLPTSMRNTWG